MRNKEHTKGTQLYEWLNKQDGFWGALIAPFLICFKYGAEFFIWAMFILVAGQLGTLINIVNRVFFQDWTWSEALYPDSSTGNFYTYALVLIASLIGPLFTRIKNKKEPMFSSISIVFSTILIFTMILCAVFFSLVSQQVHELSYTAFKDKDFVVDVKQCVFFVLSIIFAWYAFGFSLMVDNRELLQLDDDSYSQKEDNDIREASQKVPETKDDGRGITL